MKKLVRLLIIDSSRDLPNENLASFLEFKFHLKRTIETNCFTVYHVVFLKILMRTSFSENQKNFLERFSPFAIYFLKEKFVLEKFVFPLRSHKTKTSFYSHFIITVTINKKE